MNPSPFPGRHPGLGTGSRIWLVRHTEVHEDWQGKAYGNLDVPLSADGLKNAHLLASAFGDLTSLAPRWIASSPLERARILGTGIAQACSLELDVADELTEIGRGDWQGLAVTELHRDRSAEVQAFYADPWGWKGHGGECDADLCARAWPLLERACTDARGGVALMTTHYNTIRVLLGRALGVPPTRSFGIRLDPGHAALLSDGETGWTLCCSNLARPAFAQDTIASDDTPQVLGT